MLYIFSTAYKKLFEIKFHSSYEIEISTINSHNNVDFIDHPHRNALNVILYVYNVHCTSNVHLHMVYGKTMYIEYLLDIMHK